MFDFYALVREHGAEPDQFKQAVNDTWFAATQRHWNCSQNSVFLQGLREAIEIQWGFVYSDEMKRDVEPFSRS